MSEDFVSVHRIQGKLKPYVITQKMEELPSLLNRLDYNGVTLNLICTWQPPGELSNILMLESHCLS